MLTYVGTYDKLIGVEGWKTSTPPKLIKEGGEKICIPARISIEEKSLAHQN